MRKLTVADIVHDIAQLGTSHSYEYFTGRSTLRITDVRGTEGPIQFKRWDSRQTEAGSSDGSVSTNQLGTIASVFSSRPNYPIHFDRLFSAGGNSRSALETLLAYTPHFFICYPQKINLYTGETEDSLKHIMWCPDEEHEQGVITQKDYAGVISEFEIESDFGNVENTPILPGEDFESIEAKKTHTQIQVALVEIGRALNFRTWIAGGDRSFTVGNMTLGSLDGVIQSLDEVKIFYTPKIKEAARLIDCIWFTSDGNMIPAVIEVEHTTGVTSGLTRMLKFKETIPAISTTFTIVAADKLRNKVITEANQTAFRKLDARFMPYSTVRVLYGLIQKYALSKYVDYNFVYPFMEQVVES